MKKIILTMIAILYLSGCSTVSGIGKDLINSSEWVKGKVDGSN